MIPVSETLGIFAAICLIPPLYHGAVQDLKEFKFSATHFDSLWVNASFVLIILMYFMLLVEGGWIFALTLLVISIVASVIFSFIGFRYGGGGDWRALIYISWITPFMLIYVIIASVLCAVLQAFYWIARPDINIPPMYRKVPFAVSIFCGYVIALIFIIVASLPQ